MALVSGGKAFHAKALLYNTLFINNVLCGWGTFIVATSCPWQHHVPSSRWQAAVIQGGQTAADVVLGLVWPKVDGNEPV